VNEINRALGVDERRQSISRWRKATASPLLPQLIEATFDLLPLPGLALFISAEHDEAVA
jgi:hypothetical protein